MKLRSLLAVLLLTVLLAACGAPAGSATGDASTGAETSAATEASAAADLTASTASEAPAAEGSLNIVLAAYTTPREAYAEIIPLFREKYKADTGQDVTFEESYQGSGAQSRAIVEGLDADIAALSLEADINRIVDAGLITHDWKDNQYKGMVSDSVVAFAVRPGNPEGINDWADLAKSGVEVLTPNPQTSGGAQWNILALYGAALRGKVEGVAAGDEAAAREFMKSVLANVSVMDKGARESITNFENGVGDVAITYENEVLVAKQAGQAMDLVLPSSSILIENPVALIDTYVDQHGNREAVEAFIEFLFTPEVQRIFAKYGLRSVDSAVAEETADKYPALPDQFTIEEFGGWKKATPEFFGETGLYTAVIAEVQQ